MKRLLTFMFIFALLVLIFAFTSCSEKGTAQIDILKIGKADCIVISTGKQIIMIDTGEAENLDTVYDFMDKRGYDKIDTLVITHYDKDHIGGAAEIISKYNVARVVESSFKSNSQLYQDYHKVINEQGVTLAKLDADASFKSGEAKFYISVPKKSKYKKDQDNNTSLVILMEYRGVKSLFCGDALEERMEEVIEESLGKCDFVKLPHHGTYLENYDDILNELHPSYTVATCSNKNPSSQKTREALHEFNVESYETRYGTVSIIIDKNGIQIEQ